SAALRLKVSTRTERGSAPRFSIRSTTASTIVVVLPVPGPARTSSGPPLCATTRRWAPSSTGGGAARRTRLTSRYGDGFTPPSSPHPRGDRRHSDRTVVRDVHTVPAERPPAPAR